MKERDRDTAVQQAQRVAIAVQLRWWRCDGGAANVSRMWLSGGDAPIDCVKRSCVRDESVKNERSSSSNV